MIKDLTLRQRVVKDRIYDVLRFFMLAMLFPTKHKNSESHTCGANPKHPPRKVDICVVNINELAHVGGFILNMDSFSTHQQPVSIHCWRRTRDERHEIAP